MAAVPLYNAYAPRTLIVDDDALGLITTMEITAPPNNAAPFSTEKHINSAAKLSTSEGKLLTTVKGELDRINNLAEKCNRERMGQPHALDHEINLATLELTENPTAENAEKVHALMVRKRDCELSADVISNATRAAGRREIEKLTPLALRIIDTAEESFLAEAEQHREATKNQTTFSTTAENFNARLEATRAAFTEKRRWISQENAAAHFLLLELGLGHA